MFGSFIKRRILIFMAPFVVILVKFFGFIGIDVPYPARYLILLGTIAFYAIIVAMLEKYRYGKVKRRCIGKTPYM